MNTTIPRIGETGRISGVVTSWLQQEIQNSDQGRNRVLSEFDEIIPHFRRPFEASDNKAAAKGKSHYGRMKLLADRIYRDPTMRLENQVAAKMIHHSLMMVSGAFRSEAFLVSTSGTEYREYRHTHGPAGVDVAEVIGLSLGHAVGDEPHSLDALLDTTLAINEGTRELHRRMYDWVAAHSSPGLPLASPDEGPVRAMREVQRSWIGLSAAHIVMAADLRGGDLAAVPFYEPQSITDVTEPHYPFA